MIRRFLIPGICLAFLSGLLGADWPNFRGADSTSVASGESLPTALGEDKVLWKAALPGRGCGGAVIVGDRVFVTACSQKDQDRLHVLCFDARDGKKLWERENWATGRTMCHGTMSVAAPQPASDGQRVFAFFSSNDLACYDFEGNLQWFRGLTHDYQNASNSLGMASSPIVVGDLLIVQVESDSESLALGIDVKTGENRWKIPRPQVSNWCSPTLLRGREPGSDVVLLQTAQNLTAIEPATGKKLWSYDQSCSTIPSSTVFNGVVYVPSSGLTALKPSGNKTAPEKLWSSSKLGPGTASPIVVDNRVYSLKKRPGVLTCGKVADGETLWQLRLEGEFSSTPVVAGGHLYAVSEAGTVFVIRLGSDQEKGEVVSRLETKEAMLATPAVANNALYVRSDSHLWKIGERR